LCSYFDFSQGFLLIDSFFKEEELNPAKDAINDLVDELAHKLYKGGKITSQQICTGSLYNLIDIHVSYLHVMKNDIMSYQRRICG